MAEPEQAGSSSAPGRRPSPVPAASPPPPGPCAHPQTPLLPSSPVLQIHLQDLPVALKEALHIALPGLVAQAADVHPRHPGNSGGSLARPQPPLGGGRRSESAATAAAAAATGERRDGRSRTPATYASTQHASARLPPSPPSPQAEGNGRERAFASRPARSGGGACPWALQREAGSDDRQAAQARRAAPASRHVLSRARCGWARTAFRRRAASLLARKCLRPLPPCEPSGFCPLNREWFRLQSRSFGVKSGF